MRVHLTPFSTDHFRPLRTGDEDTIGHSAGRKHPCECIAARVTELFAAWTGLTPMHEFNLSLYNDGSDLCLVVSTLKGSTRFRPQQALMLDNTTFTTDFRFCGPARSANSPEGRTQPDTDLDYSTLHELIHPLFNTICAENAVLSGDVDPQAPNFDRPHQTTIRVSFT